MRVIRSAALLLLAGILFSAVSLQAQSETRPPTEQLLPETAVLYVQIRDLPELIEDMEETGMGRLLADEKIAPLAEELWAQAREGFNQLSTAEELGLDFDDLTKVAHGEICFAIIAPRRADAQFAFFIDINEEEGAADRLLESGRVIGEREGAEFVEEETEDAKFTTVNGPDGNQFTMFRKDGTVVVTTNRDLSQQILDRWNGREVEKIRPLVDNRKFATIMNRCRGSKQEPPELRFFVDPIEMFKSLTRGDAGSQLAIGFLPVLGLDGLLAIGGSSVIAEGEFQGINRMHIMLSNPRAGIIEMLALKPGEYQPRQWVPANASNYMSTSWDIDRMFAELTKIVDTFSGEGTFEKQIAENINEELEMDFKADVLGALDGNLTWVTWAAKPWTVNGQANGVGLGLKDVELAETSLRKIMDRISEEQGENESLVEESHEGVTLWRFDNTEMREQFEMMREDGRTQIALRAPEPAFAIVGETLILSDSADFVRLAIDTERGSAPRLADQQDFKTVGKKMTSLLQSDMPAAVMFSQPALVMEQFYEIAKGDDAKNFLTEASGDNPFVDGIRRAMDDHPLPAFEDLKKYFTPQGAFITSDDTGYHILQFEMRPPQETSDTGR